MSSFHTLDSIRKRVEDNHPGDVSFGHEDVEYLLSIIDSVREYLEEIQTPYNDEYVLDRIYEMVGGKPVSSHRYMSHACYHHEHQRCLDTCGYCGHGCICSCHRPVVCDACLDAPPKTHTCSACGRTSP